MNQAKQMRRRAAEIGEDIETMIGTQCDIAERSDLGWRDDRIERIERDIAAAKAARTRLLAQAREIEANRLPAA